MAPNVINKVKVEIEKLLKAKFIKTVRYITWLSNIMPVIKKDDKLCIGSDFRNLNNAIPNNKYPM